MKGLNISSQAMLNLSGRIWKHSLPLGRLSANDAAFLFHASVNTPVNQARLLNDRKLV